MIPAVVLNALKLGRPLAAKLDAGESTLHAWIYVSTTSPRDELWDNIRDKWTRTREASGSYVPPHEFLARYTRLTDYHMAAEERGDLDIALRHMPAEDWLIVTSDLSELESVLSAFVSDLQALRPPSTVEYPEPPMGFATRISVADLLNRRTASSRQPLK